MEAAVTLEVGALDDDALNRELRVVEARRRHDEAVQAALVDEIDRRRLWRTDGHASVAGHVRVLTKRPTYEITQLLQTGRLMREQAAFATALASGTLGVAQAHLIARARAHPRCGDELDAELDTLVDHAQHEPFSAFKTRIADWVNLHDQDGANDQHAASHERRDAFFGFAGDEFHGWITGAKLDGDALKQIFDAYVRGEWDKDWAWTVEHHGDRACAADMPRTDAQRRFDALVAIFAASLDDTAPDAPDATTAAKVPPGATPVVNVITDSDTFLQGLARWFGITTTTPAAPAAGSARHRFCHTATGVAISPDEMVAAALAGHVRRVVMDAHHVVIDLGRTRRLFTGAVRVAAHMDRHRCCWPGCELPATRCQTDHLTPWSHGGSTRPDDGAPMCPRHNRWKNHGYHVTRDDHGHIHTYRPDGTEIC